MAALADVQRFAYEAKTRLTTIKRIVWFTAPIAWLLGFFLGLVFVDAAISIVNPLIYRAIINNGILKEDATLITKLASLLCILAVFEAALGLSRSYLSARIGARVVLSLRTKLFRHIQQMPLAFFTRTQTGALISRLDTDIIGAQRAFTDILSNALGNAITVALILSAMAVLSWQIMLAALGLLLTFIMAARFWGSKLQAITRESYDLTAAMNSFMVERFNVAGALLTKLFGRPQEEDYEFEAKATRVADIAVKRTLYGRFFFTALLLVAMFGTAVAYGWGGLLAVKHILDVGTVVALVSYLVQLYGPLTGLSNVQVDIMTAFVSFERMFELLDLRPMIQEKPLAVTIPSGPAKMSFSRVSFRYPASFEVSLASLEPTGQPEAAAQKTVLHDIDFTVEPGQLVALVGPSGAGKTTITQLVGRLYDVQSGSVTISGIDVRDAKLDSLHQRIGMVTQDAHLFHDTIRANLLYAKPNATEAEMIDALRAAQILPLVECLPKGLDTLVGERGYRFSGGEKQRLAIARVLLKAPDIVILDEATAHLDSESEDAIRRAFEIALAGRTSIVIAHRLSTILLADQILVMQDGRIVERGTHLELLKSRGLYAELYQRQFAHDLTVK